MTNSQHFVRRSTRWQSVTAFLMVSLFSVSGSWAGEVSIDTDIDAILHCRAMNKQGASKATDAVASCKKALEPFEGVAEQHLSQYSLEQLSARLDDLAKAYENARDYDKALPLYERALRISEKANGPEHEETAAGLNNLASLYDNMKQYDKALPLYERALRIREKVNGPEHEDTATVLNNLAWLYDNMKQYDKALPLYERALRIREKVYGPEHEKTATVLNNLAVMHYNAGRFAKALPLIERALRIREKVLGPDHPDTQNSKSNLTAIREELPASQAQQPQTPPPAASAPKTTTPSTRAPAEEGAAATGVSDACSGLSNGQHVKVPLKGYPQPQSALVLDSGNGKVSVRVMGMGAAAGKKLTLACSAVRR